MELMIPSSFEELVGGHIPLRVEDPWDVAEVGDRGMEDVIQRQMDISFASGALSLDQDNVRDWWCTINGFNTLSSENKCLAADTLIELCTKALGAVNEKLDVAGKNAVKMLFYFLQELVKRFETLERGRVRTDITGKKKSKKSRVAEDELNWCDFRPTVLDLFHRVLSLDQGQLWTMSVIQENFIKGLWGIPLALLEERPHGVGGVGSKETSVRARCVDVITLAAAHMSGDASTGLATALLDAVCRSGEHLDKPVTEICRRTNGALAGAIIAEMGKMNMAELAKSGPGVKNVGAFLVTYAEQCPADMAVRLAMIMHQLDSDVWNIRGSILTAMGHVVTFIHNTCDVKPQQQQQQQDEENANKAKDPDGDKENTKVGVGGEGNSDAERAQLQESSDGGGSDEKKEEEGEGEEHNTAKLLSARDAMLNMLVERTHDVNAFVRAVVLKIWASLLERAAIPVRRMASVAEIAVDRLFDKTAAVRKAAVALLSALLDNNPFSGSLNVMPLRARHDEIVQALKDRISDMRVVMQQSAVASGQAVPEDFLDADGQPTWTDDDDDEYVMSDEVAQDGEVCALRAEKEFCTSALAFLEVVDKGLPKIEQMITSKTTSDVVEALRFFTRAVNFGVQGSAKSLRVTFSLVFHQEEAIRLECLHTFRMVFLTNGSDDDARALPPARVAMNIVSLCKRCGPAEMASVEKIVGEVFLREHLKLDVVTALWQMAASAAAPTPTLTTGDTSSPQRDPTAATPATTTGESSVKPELGPCLQVLSMISKLQPSVLTPSRIHFVVQAGLGGKAMADGEYMAMKAAAQCLQNLPARLPLKGIGPDAGTQEAMDAAVPFLRDAILATHLPDTEKATRAWFGVCEECMHALFHVLIAPDLVLPLLVKPLYCSVMGESDSGRSESDDRTENVGDTEEQGTDGDASVHTRASSPFALSRLLFLLGQACVCSLVYTERIATLAKRFKPNAATMGDGEGGEAAASSHQEHEIGSDKEGGGGGVEGEKQEEKKSEVDAMEEEMGMVAAADAEHERLYHTVTEQELALRQDLLLGKFHMLIAFVCANQARQFNHPMLRETAVLALCRYMAISSELCEMYLPLLFTVVEREPSPALRTSVVIALGDLAFRFPNSLEPWTARFYARLTDKSVNVRFNTLMTLTHLILNDMIKVKGQVSHIVTCLNDTCDRVSSMAHLFFTELAKRSNNPVYNLLGDIIGTLSRGQEDSLDTAADPSPVAAGALVDAKTAVEARVLSPQEFQSTMTFLLGFIKQDKQGDALVDRLLSRLCVASATSQRRNLAFCLAQLPITEKGVKKMAEGIRGYKDCLHDDEVYEHFYTAVSRVRKASSSGVAASKKAIAEAAAVTNDDGVAGDKEEGKNVVDEFICLMEAVRGAGEGAEINLENFVASSAEVTASAAAASTKAKAARAKNRKSVADTSRRAKKTGGAVDKKAKKQPKKKVVKEEWDSDEEEEEEEEEEADLEYDAIGASKSKARGTTRRTRTPLAEAN